MVHAITAAVAISGVEARPLRSGRDIVVASWLLRYAAEDVRQDGGYQRELSLWTIRDERAHRHGVGLPASRGPAGSVPWAGLVRRATEIAEPAELAARLANETVLVFITVEDARPDPVGAGYALARLAGGSGPRAGGGDADPAAAPGAGPGALCADLGLAGFPQALLRLGYSAETDPPTPRRAMQEVAVTVPAKAT
ncbi:MAG TPA: hypothetical protein VGL47_10760 [Amycolatopsis sp.]|uniref:Nitroreductase domain-containing protein n=1 Tax=Amycolatopsis nalaikhensis TaxID=715472 RepID=A0ABY8XZJ6_9PSEU|nr:hypothetical protein [Amycolatopsis sp. 2-2]WIV61023.1 hypothetical protein QP939_21695 [Amycolatopsis sp. 2-2]